MMAVFKIYELDEDEYVALPAYERGPFDVCDGVIDIDIKGEWIPGSHQDLRASLNRRAVQGP